RRWGDSPRDQALSMPSILISQSRFFHTCRALESSHPARFRRPGRTLLECALDSTPLSERTTTMFASRVLISTLKEAPSDAEVMSHKLMLRAGLIRRVAAGIYTWMPMGLRSLRKVENIVREEMNRAGAVEVLMPAVQPAELWQESGRWAHYGPELL